MVGLMEPSAGEGLTVRLVVQSVSCWNHYFFFVFLKWLSVTNPLERTKSFGNSSCLGNYLQLSGYVWVCATVWTYNPQKEGPGRHSEKPMEELGSRELVPISKAFSASFTAEAWHIGRPAAFLSPIFAHYSLMLRIGRLSRERARQ